MQITIRPADDELRHWVRRIEDLGGKGTRAAIARAVNRSTNSAKSKVAKSISQSTSIPLAEVKRGLSIQRAKAKGDGAIAGVILAEGSGIPLKFFGAKQTAQGVNATIFGSRRLFPSAFIWAGSRTSTFPVRDKHVFICSGQQSLPIAMLYGPGVATAAIKGDAAQAFVTVAQEMLPARISHELNRLLSGKA